MEALSVVILIVLFILWAQRQPTNEQMAFWAHVKSEGERYTLYIKRMGVTHEEVLEAPAQIRTVLYTNGKFDPDIIAAYFEAKALYEQPHTRGVDIEWPVYKTTRQSIRRRRDF